MPSLWYSSKLPAQFTLDRLKDTHAELPLVYSPGKQEAQFAIASGNCELCLLFA